jgi:hypothetical protein
MVLSMVRKLAEEGKGSNCFCGKFFATYGVYALH